jgi:hypothetical protein
VVDDNEQEAVVRTERQPDPEKTKKKKKKKKNLVRSNAFTAFDSNISTNDDDLHAFFLDNDFETKTVESHIVFLDYTTYNGLLAYGRLYSNIATILQILCCN